MTKELQPKIGTRGPIRDAAQLLRRIGFFLLFGAAPAFAPYYKRSIFIFPTIGAVLLALAAMIEGELNLRRLAGPPLPVLLILCSLFVYLFWSGLSLAWTPFPGESGALYAGFVIVILAGFLLVLFLSDRVSASRLYVLAGGVTIGWIICFGAGLTPNGDIDFRTVQRSLVTLIPLTPPSLVWLMYRRRGVLAFILTLVAISTVWLLQSPMASAALGATLLVFIAALAMPDRMRRGLATFFGGLILVAPFIPVILTEPLTFLAGEDSAIAHMMQDWYQIVLDDPFRLLTGHGYDTILRAATAGLIPPTTPHGLIIDIWFELGLIGALALAGLLVGLTLYSAMMTRPSAAALLAAMAGLFVIGLFGGNLPEAHWLVSIAIAANAISALERGQYKTARPRSRDIAALKAKQRRFSILPDWLDF